MYSYVNEELPNIIQEHFNINKDRQSIMGHRYVSNDHKLHLKNTYISTNRVNISIFYS